ncbi:MAG: CDP-diacylglycerol--glycerol-3-phosphate 3-phosphatidyltransferase [Coriobacteriales bacterium]|jgi:CDP-diacylglycerol--glycerol-3-phosphate 3-phosphatidyltransferase|nr:CDP-diacylglycerol--glycerol-3-phosphate 3-phosphatidyltransferase [Coriobacteriales bacterium]MDO5708618.1 CDP-diacylglycerol--glycerol-3-phosphate 3-phosphatidyltransferase [Coriobacteriales bacterium]
MAGNQQSNIWTPANIVTCTRIALMPVWLVIAEIVRTHGMLNSGNVWAWTSLILYALISLTDKLDGYLARSRNEVTDFGKFVDPIADKMVVTCALLYLLELGLCPSWAVLLVIAREFLVSGLRMVVAAKGVVVAASNLGKWKTATTMIAICGLLLSVTLPLGNLTYGLQVASFISMAVALALTAWSGIEYFIKCWPYVAGTA